MTCRTLVGVMCTCVALLGAGVSGQQGGAGEWRVYSGTNGSTKYSPLDQITASNVSHLHIVWRRPAIDPDLLAAHRELRVNNNFRATPIMVNGVLYASNGLGLAEAFDPATGRTIWSQQPPPEGLMGGTAARGVAYYADAQSSRILTYTRNFLYALDTRTGEPIRTFGENGRVNLTDGMGPLTQAYRWTSTPVVVRDVVVMGSSMADQDSAARREGTPGDVRAYDVHTGKLRWTFRIIPRPGEEGNDTWESDSWAYTGAGNVWSLISADDELGYVYLPTTSVTNDMYGGHRPGANLFADSIVCVNAATGKKVWHFQTIHHDLFDYDNPAPPVLTDITVDGRRIKALAQVTKQAFTYVLDRTNGRPVWPIVERPVGQSNVPGEKSWPTQPVPSKPPAFDRQGITDDDLIDFTPELKAAAREIVKHYVTGPIFTPPSLVGEGASDTKGTLQLPGKVGGADWTGAAFDPETGYLFVPSMTSPFVANLLPGKPDETNLRYRASTRENVLGPQGLPLLKPPYGRITALNLNTGELVWQVANGDGPRNHPSLKGLNLPPLGQAVRAAPLVTRTLLFVSEGDQINVSTPPGGGGDTLRAFDKATGQVVWETKLDAGSTGTLMTYMHQGTQYIVVAIGSQQHTAEFVALSLQ